MDNISVHIADGDGGGWLTHPGKEEPQIAGVVTVGACVGPLPPQALLKLFDFGEHFYLLMVKWFRTEVGSEIILPPGGIMSEAKEPKL
jgi:hypothetical protein